MLRIERHRNRDDARLRDEPGKRGRHEERGAGTDGSHVPPLFGNLSNGAYCAALISLTMRE